MSRIITIMFIIGFTLVVDKLMSAEAANNFLSNNFNIINDMKFVLTGILVGGIYIFKFGANYSEDGVYGPPKRLSDFSILALIPGKRFLIKMTKTFLAPMSKTKIGEYFTSLYCPPVPSERVLGGFFFGKTMITTAIAFYSVGSVSLILILGFSAVFDSLTGTYQHTLMNYFHRSYFVNSGLRFLQNLVKRFAVDIIRAEIIMLLLMGMEILGSSTQFHIFRNRLVSATYYFNAFLIDKLVEMGAISRNFRSTFVIFASTIGGMLCLLDFAKTSFPKWVPESIVASIPASMPGPLALLMYFNAIVFVSMGALYLAAVYAKKVKEQSGDQQIGKASNVLLMRIITMFSNI
jgi:hypothetical protein